MSRLKKTKLVRRKWLSKKAFEIEVLRPHDFTFISGQSIRFFYGNLERSYSIISSDKEPEIQLCIRFVQEGVFSRLLATVDTGFEMQFTGPHGYFLFKPSHRPAIFVATGTGIAPFVSMARSGIHNFTLLHGVYSEEDLYYESLFRKSANKYVPCVSNIGNKNSKMPDIFYGRVTDYIRNQLPRNEYDFYLCGRAEMVREVTLLVDVNFPGSFIYNEVFY